VIIHTIDPAFVRLEIYAYVTSSGRSECIAVRTPIYGRSVAIGRVHSSYVVIPSAQLASLKCSLFRIRMAMHGLISS